MQSPLISVIIPAYNRGKYIVSAILSVLEQSFKNGIEVIVVDDGSTDNTSDEVIKLQEAGKNIILEQQENKGPSIARNAGFRKARGKFIQFLDSDDMIEKEKVALQLEALIHNPGVDYATCGWSLLDDCTGKVKGIFGLDKGSEWRVLPNFLYFDFWPNGTPLYRREICEKTGPWLESMKAFEDWEWHIRMALRGGRGIHVPKSLMFVRDHGGPRLSRTQEGMQATNIESFNLFLEVILCQFSESAGNLRRYGAVLASLLYRAAFWNFRVGKVEQGYHWGTIAGQVCTSRTRRHVYNLTLKMVRSLGINRSIYLWDKLSSLNGAIRLRRFLWGK